MAKKIIRKHRDKNVLPGQNPQSVGPQKRPLSSFLIGSHEVIFGPSGEQAV